MNNDLSIRALLKTFGEFQAVDNVSFDVPQGSFFSILGPSGCGKTTLLRMISGFEEPTSGDIEIRGKSMLGVPPNKRPVNLVFQHLALFPMMDVAENIGFGLKRRGFKSAVIKSKIEAVLERVGLPGYGLKQVSQLSGGQRQRVAIARCLVLEPSVLLLDEPLGALDLKLREQMKVELKKLQSKVGTTFVYITHDQSEALVMSDKVAVMNKGCFEQVGSPKDLYGNPETPFVARFVGENNRWEVTIIDSCENKVTVATPEGYTFNIRSQHGFIKGEKADLFLRPEAMLIEPDQTSEMNIFRVTVKSILFDGANSRLLTVTGNDRELIVSLPQNRQFDYIEPGHNISVGWLPDSGVCFKAEV
ncbi:ABC transporter ATP-binding protein [Maridesulfovibrio bastinii]|uniref:ABC transporter ATP-binding protein n=1 Tax=Maridesulfovibrio bastinii TaxID=47157 RepID=UPI0004143958|nr:ABC transporter ATP-binding protein [Maridesulfovibrio bastinii]